MRIKHLDVDDRLAELVAAVMPDMSWPEVIGYALTLVVAAAPVDDPIYLDERVDVDAEGVAP